MQEAWREGGGGGRWEEEGSWGEEGGRWGGEMGGREGGRGEGYSHDSWRVRLNLGEFA